MERKSDSCLVFATTQGVRLRSSCSGGRCPPAFINVALSPNEFSITPEKWSISRAAGLALYPWNDSPLRNISICEHPCSSCGCSTYRSAPSVTTKSSGRSRGNGSGGEIRGRRRRIRDGATTGLQRGIDQPDRSSVCGHPLAVKIRTP